MKTLCKLAILVLAGIHLAKPFLAFDLSWPLSVAGVIVLFTGLALMGNGFKKATIVFFTTGAAALIYTGQPIIVWVAAVNSMTSVIAVIAIMQTFALPIKLGEYNEAVSYWANRMFKGEGPLFLFTTVVTHIFTSFLIFGAIPVIVALMEDTLQKKVRHYKQFMAAATSRGYCLASLWAPGAVNLFLVIQATGVTWTDVFLPGLVLSLIGLALSCFIETRFGAAVGRAGAQQQVHGRPPDDGRKQNRAIHIILVVLSLITMTLIFDHLHVGAAYNRIILAGVAVISVWMLLFVKHPELGTTLRAYWEDGVLKAADLAAFFIAMGVFSAGLDHSGFFGIVQASLQSVATSLGLLSIAVIPLLIIACAVAGIHPFMTIIIFGKMFMGMQLPIPTITLALALALGASISYIISPFAGVIMTIAKFIDARTQDVAIRWNWFFALSFFIVGVLFAYCWGKIFG